MFVCSSGSVTSINTECIVSSNSKSSCKDFLTASICYSLPNTDYSNFCIVSEKDQLDRIIMHLGSHVSMVEGISAYNIPELQPSPYTLYYYLI